MSGTSRVTGDRQARICERLGVKFPGPTRLDILLKGSALSPSASEGMLRPCRMEDTRVR